MAVATFDTLKFANTLKAAGVPPQQAEAQAVAFADIIALNLKDLVTKDDLNRAVEELERKMEKLVEDLRVDNKAVRSEMATNDARYRGEFALLKWMLGVSITATVGVLIRLFLMRGI
jgi:G3E family GTPase